MSKFATVKQHVRNHKTAYTLGGATVVVAAVAAGGYYYGVRTGANKAVALQYVSIVGNENTVTQTFEVYIEALGDPGNIVQEFIDGRPTNNFWASQNQAAKEVGAWASDMSKHLNGKIDHINGRTFKRVGKPVVPPLSDVA
jgi:hypothetical protein